MLPIGKERLEFNGRYVFYPKTIVDIMDEMKLLEFCIANPKENIVTNSHLYAYDNYEGDVQIMGCFLFEKKKYVLHGLNNE